VFFSDALLQNIFAGGARMSELSADGPIAVAVQREIEEAIARSLASSLKLQVNSSLEHRLLSDCHVSAEKDRWVACSLIVRSGAPLIVVLLHPAVVDELAPGAAKVSLDEQVVRRRNAIGMECVRAEVLLGHVDVSCADLARLSLGDVLVLNEPLSGAARLQSMQGELIAPVNIGRVGDLTAVQVN